MVLREWNGSRAETVLRSNCAGTRVARMSKENRQNRLDGRNKSNNVSVTNEVP
jgi:hypothetical protein